MSDSDPINYSPDDKKVLEYFFTNIDEPVFAAKNFHPEVWALMQARYSRSSEGLRESFLKLLKEDPENYKNLISELKNSHGGLHIKHATEKAIQFMEKWVLGYGHSSVAEGAVIGIGLEGVSILATKVIEDNRISSFTEKSTRYVSFSKSSFYMDSDLAGSEHAIEIRALFDNLFDTYEELREPVLAYVKKVAPLSEGTTPAAWERACAARTFDAIRYLLPTATKTSLGWTVNARQLAHAISKLLSHPLKEINEIGEQVKKEASKVLPSLLRFADKNNYMVKTQQEMTRFASQIKLSKSPEITKPEVTLAYSPPDIEEHILAAMLFRFKNSCFTNVLDAVKPMSKKERESLFDTYLKNMSDFDHPLRELEHSQFTFEIVMDYGAFRDLQRHRICTQTSQLLTADLGYDISADVVKAGVKDKYVKAMEKAKKVYKKLSDKFPLQAQYVLPLGFRKRYIVTMNLREIYHFVKLRTIPLAHESYRKIAYKIYEIMKDKYPLLSKYMVINYSEEELGRLKSEEKTEQLKTVGPL